MKVITINSFSIPKGRSSVGSKNSIATESRVKKAKQIALSMACITLIDNLKGQTGLMGLRIKRFQKNKNLTKTGQPTILNITAEDDSKCRIEIDIESSKMEILGNSQFEELIHLSIKKTLEQKKYSDEALSLVVGKKRMRMLILGEY